ncbi:MAG: hypothetical protein WA323_13640 [Candidatus Nitrosopolaris sp.]
MESPSDTRGFEPLEPEQRGEDLNRLSKLEFHQQRERTKVIIERGSDQH